MKNSIILSLLSAVMLMCACNGDYYRDSYYDDRYYQTSTEVLTLRNFSSDTTVWFIPEKQYAESLAPVLSEWQKISVCEIQPHSSYVLTFDSDDSYETPIETYGRNDKLSVYVFKKSVWYKHSWSELVAGQMWCGHCSLTAEEAVALKGILTYPMR